MGRRTAAEAHFSPEELQAFVKRLASEPGLTLSRLRDLAAEEGLEMSLMAAKTTREKHLDPYLAKLEASAEFARRVANIQQAAPSESLADASATMLSQEIFDIINNGHFDVIAEPGNPDGARIDLDALSKIISRMRTGDHRARRLEAELKERTLKLQALETELARKQNEAKNTAKDTTLTPEERERRYKEIFGIG